MGKGSYKSKNRGHYITNLNNVLSSEIPQNHAFALFDPPRIDTPPKIHIEPENDGLVQMIFLVNWVNLRFHVNLVGGFNPFEKY